jgi:hypothetical protein
MVYNGALLFFHKAGLFFIQINFIVLIAGGAFGKTAELIEFRLVSDFIQT